MTSLLNSSLNVETSEWISISLDSLTLHFSNRLEDHEVQEYPGFKPLRPRKMLLKLPVVLE